MERLYGKEPEKFQFLIGTVKTYGEERKKEKEKDVSIPHRYCKNLKAITEFEKTQWGFQFLIGTVKTN